MQCLNLYTQLKILFCKHTCLICCFEKRVCFCRRRNADSKCSNYSTELNDGLGILSTSHHVPAEAHDSYYCDAATLETVCDNLESNVGNFKLFLHE